MNTPQFDWALNDLGQKAQPVPPIYQPEAGARRIVFAGLRPRREIAALVSTIVAILANRVAPGFADRYLAGSGSTGQMPVEPVDWAAGNLFVLAAGDVGANGRFGRQARGESWDVVTSRHRNAIAADVAGLVLAGQRALRPRL